MSTLQPGDRVLVTGGSGYIASHIIEQLLRGGFEVRATVRNPDDDAKTSHLRAFEGADRLELVAADLMKKGDFHEPVAGCKAVVHAASSVRLNAKDPQRDIVDVAVEGTRNVFEAIDAAQGIHTVVVTSSIAAVIDDAKDPSYRFDEDDWNESATVHTAPYPLSKAMAERMAWTRAEQGDYRVVTLNPGLVLGPVFTKGHIRSSPNVLHDLLSGKFPLAPRFRFSVVDVRDVAKAHLEALLRPGAQGRHIISNRNVSMRELADILRAEHPSRPVPRFQMPNFAMYAVALFDKRLSWDFLRRNLDVERRLDNTKSKQALGIEYRPVDQTILDTARSFVDAGLL
ncbi:MAG: NAD-dependent epimerase/dehydratase family protein [Nannocystaceae bacterium]